MHSVAALVQHFSSINARDDVVGDTGERNRTDATIKPWLQEAHELYPEELKSCDNRAIDEANDDNFEHENTYKGKKTAKKDEKENETEHSKNAERAKVRKTSKLNEAEQEEKESGDEGSSKETDIVTKYRDCKRQCKRLQETEMVKGEDVHENYERNTPISNTNTVLRKRAAPPPPVVVTARVEGHINNDRLVDNSEISIREDSGATSEATGIVNNNYSNGHWQDHKKNRISYPVILNPFLDNSFSGNDNIGSSCMSKLVSDTSLEDSIRHNSDRSDEPMKDACKKDAFVSLKQNCHKYPEEFNPFEDSGHADNKDIVNNNVKVGNSPTHATVKLNERRTNHGHNVTNVVEVKAKCSTADYQSTNILDGQCSGKCATVISTPKRQPVLMSPPIGQNNSPNANYSSLKKKRAPLPPRNVRAKPFALHTKDATASDSYPDDLNPF